MLQDYAETVNSDNRFARLETDKEDDIVIGGTCKHTFYLPFKYSDYISNSKVLYRQGLDTVLEKYPADFVITEYDDNTSTVDVNLTALDTANFKSYSLLDTYVQMRIETITSKILFDKVYKVNVRNPIADINPPNN